MELNKRLIGIRIMQRRKALSLTQEELAEKVGFSKNHISSVERGKYTPTTQLIFQICAVMGETPDYYLIGKPSGETDALTDLIKKLPSQSQKMVYKLIETYIENIHTI